MSIDRLKASLSDRYRVEREIGSGGMATVYLASDLKHNRRVAIKVLRSELAETLGAERFTREIQIAAQLSHPHILPLYDSGNADGLLYYVMPYIEGISLRDRLQKEKQLPVDDAVRLARGVADALTYAHAHGILHRDIKPENILIAGNDALVADFGIARAIGVASGQRLTGTGFVIGSPGYMSPEQAAGEELDGRSDVYSLACVLYETLTGQPPFTGSNAQALLAQQLTGTAPSVRSVRDSVTEPLAQAIARALARFKADRFANAEQFALALTSAAAQRSGEQAAAGTKRRIGSLTLSALAVAVLLLAFNAGGVRDSLLRRFGAAAVTKSADPGPSLVVLPFENVGANPDEEYFSDGLTEELIATLSQLRALRVAARTSSFAFKNKAADARQIGKALGVATVLTGSVRKTGNRVRVTAQLVDAASGLDLWSQTYEEDRPLTEIFDIQSQLALRIAQALEMNLSVSERGQLTQKPTENLEAYQLYLKGLYFWNQRGAGLFTAAEYFAKAIALDSQYAKPWAGLASAYGPLGLHSYVHPRVSREHMGQAARRAVALDDKLGNAHAVLAAYYNIHEWNWAAAEKEFLRALEVEPHNTLALNWYGYFLEHMGRFDEAIATRQEWQRQEPMDRRHGPGFPLRQAGRYQLAEAALREATAYHPEYWQSHESLSRVYDETGRPEQAISEAETAVKFAGATPRARANLAYVLARGGSAGQSAEARRLLEQLRAESRESDIFDPHVAPVFLVLGDREGALQWLEASYRQRHPFLPTIHTERRFQPLRDDPRFQDLLRRIGFRT